MTQDAHSSDGAPFPPLTIRYQKRDEESTVELGDRSSVVIGRDRNVDLRLDTTSVSRAHARIERDGDAFVVVDNGSRNGTFVNGVRTVRGVLALGDVIALGEARIRFGDAPPAAVSSEHAAPAGEDGDAFRDRRLGAGEFPAPPGSAPPRRPPMRRSSAVVAALWLLVFSVAVGWWVARGFRLFSPGDGDPARDPVASAPGPESAAPPAEVEPTAAPELPSSPAPPAEAPPEFAVAPARPEPAPEPPRSPDDDVAPVVPPPADAGPISAASSDESAARTEARFLALLESKSWRDARTVAEFLASVSESDARRAYWRSRAEEIRTAALEDFRAVEAELGELTADGRAPDALRRLLDVRSRYSGMEFFDALVPRYVEAGIAGIDGIAPSNAFASSRADELREGIAVALEDCRFGDMAHLYLGLVALDPPLGERAKLLRRLVEAQYMDIMFEEFLARVGEARPRVSPLHGFPGRTLAADESKVTFELEFDGAPPVRDTVAWRRVTFARKWELFRSVPLSPDAVIGAAAFGFRHGHEEGGHEMLLRLKRQEKHSDVADRLLALNLDVPLPADGFVEYRGRLVEPSYRDADIARRERLEAEARRARDEMRRLKQEDRLGAYLALAEEHRSKGHFQTGQTILTALARRFPSTLVGARARELSGDPLLRVLPLHETGPSSNRLDIYFLGEGYQIRDDQQEDYLSRARAALKHVLAQEPYREYESCFNFWAVQLGSKDAGADRNPGDVRKDTPLDGKVDYDRFMVDHARVRSVLARLGEGGEDGQAVVLGNNSAGVASGSPGICCVSKVAITALGHELGHSLAGLHDEYDYAPGTSPERRTNVPRDMSAATKAVPPNLMYGSDRDDVIARAHWRDWIDAGEDAWWNGMGVSAFEGARMQHFNYYRPQSTCKMRSAGVRFCVVCMERMVLAIYRYVRPIDRVDPSPRVPLRVTTSESVAVRVWPIQPKSHALHARWRLERLPDPAVESGVSTVSRPPAIAVPLPRAGRHHDPEGRSVEYAILNGRELRPGSYRLTVVIEDPTPWVLSPGGEREGERASKTSDSRTWEVTVNEE